VTLLLVDPRRVVALVRAAAVIVLAWICLGSLVFAKHWLLWHRSRDGSSLAETAVPIGIFITLWAVATPLIVQLWRTFPVRRPRVVRNALLLTLSSGAVVTVRCVLNAALLGATWNDFSWEARTFLDVYLDVIPVLNIVLVTQHLDHRAANAGRRRDEAELQAELANIELQQLRAALDPHFLFNALNAVLALIPRSPAKARSVVKGLGALVSRSRHWQGRSEIELEEELRFVSGYLDIQRARFGDALLVSIDVEPDVLRSLVPPLLVQTLVENAVIHGLRSDVGRGAIHVRAAHSGDDLRIEVRDSGRGFVEELTHSNGIGITNARSRLALMYGSQQSLTFRKVAGGFVAAATLPIRQRTG
jgi:two-component system LytT family sensor kinase